MPQVTLPVRPEGLILLAYVGPSLPRQEALRSAGRPVPDLMPIQALVDTGATGTMVDKSVIAALNLSPVGVVPIHTPSTGTQPVHCNVFDLFFGIPGAKPGEILLRIGILQVTESDFSAHGGHYKALLGRDVLGRGLLVYNGSAGLYTLAF